MNSQKWLCKLTDENARTHGGMQWGSGVTHQADGSGELCGPGWIHYYDHPLLAVLLNPIHADFSQPKLWQVKVSGRVKHDYGLKSGAEEVTTITEIPLPEITTEQRVRFAILCALRVYATRTFKKWASNWLNGKNRSDKAAAKAETEARTGAAVWAADAAAWADREAARTADREAAWAVSEAAWAAQTKKLDIIALVKKAVR